MHLGEEKAGARVRIGLAACLGILVYFLLAVPVASDQAEEPILSPSLVAELKGSCDLDEVSERAWFDTVRDLTAEDVDTSYLSRLGAEVMQILVSCLDKRLAAFDCSKMTCGDARGALPQLQQLYVEYFMLSDDERFPIDTSALSPESGVPAWDKYQEKLASCYRSAFEACDCDLEGLLALWVNLVLDEPNMYLGATELADEVVAKYEQCLIEKIKSMTDVAAMADLVLERDPDPEAWFRYVDVREDTIYNNYTVACAVLKRLIELYRLDDDDIDYKHSLDAGDVDRHLCSSCCDTLWLLQWMLYQMRVNSIWRCPLTNWEEGEGCDLIGLWNFRHVVMVSSDPYTLCRKNQLDALAADCDPNAFCRILSCGSGSREALEARLADPREAAFLELFKARLEQCSGKEVDLQDVVDWCVTVPVSKTWDTLKTAEPEPAIPDDTRSCAEDLGEASGSDYKASGYSRYRVPVSQHLDFFRDEIDAYLGCSKLGPCAQALKIWLIQAPLDLQTELAEVFWEAFQEANR
jgi:hypothetical protein